MSTLPLHVGGSKNKPVDYQVLNQDDLKSLGLHVYFISRSNDIRTARVTSIKTWKRKSDIEIHLKYGLYEYAITTFKDGEFYPTVLVKLIDTESNNARAAYVRKVMDKVFLPDISVILDDSGTIKACKAVSIQGGEYLSKHTILELPYDRVLTESGLCLEDTTIYPEN